MFAREDVGEVVDNFELTKDVIEELRQGRLAQKKMAEREQRLAAAQAPRTKNMKSGFLKFRIHPVVYHYWRNRLGPKCWDEGSDFLRDFLRDNPECVVKNESNKIQIGYHPTNPKFHKSYAV